MKKIITLLFFMLSLNTFAMVEYKAKVMGMVCSFCANGIEKQLKTVDDVIGVKVDLDNYLVHVQAKNKLDTELLEKKIVEAGYKVEEIQEVNEKMDK